MAQVHIIGDQRQPAANSNTRASRHIRQPLEENDADYFDRRSREELEFAMEIADPTARSLHLDLANRHAQLAASLREAIKTIG